MHDRANKRRRNQVLSACSKKPPSSPRRTPRFPVGYIVLMLNCKRSAILELHALISEGVKHLEGVMNL